MSIGYGPYHLQQLNTTSQHGKVTILHAPHAVPMRCQAYQLVVGAASAAEYSVTIEGRLAEDGKVNTPSRSIVDKHDARIFYD